MKSAYRRGNKEVAGDHKEDLVGPTAQQVNKAERTGIGESRKRRIFGHAGADGLEGPLKRVEYGNPGDRDQAQRFDGGVACGFRRHDFLSFLFASAGSIDYINAHGWDGPLIPLTTCIT